MNAKHRRLTHCFAALSIVVAACTLAANSHAALIFYDDFEDGDHLDGSPVSWDITGTEPWMREVVVDGNLVITSRQFNFAVVDFDLADVSIRAQGRVGNPDDVVVVGARSVGTYDNYYVRLGYSSILETTALGVDPGISSGRLYLPTDLDPYQEDVVLQLDCIGNQLSAWAWRPGEDMPDAPLITTTSDIFPSGAVGVSVWNNLFISEPVVAIFRYVHVADVHIHPADFDNDGDVDDEDLLIWEQGNGMQSGAAPANGDADYDGDVDYWDFMIWEREYGFAVPEPSTLLLCCLAIGFVVVERFGTPKSRRGDKS